MNQQNQTLKYFGDYAKEWEQKSKQKNVIKERNNYVLKVLKERAKTKKALDIGCGTGNLVKQIAKKGTKATGIDFSEKMISIARKGKPKSAEFKCCSIFEYNPKERFDLISANGFIEYISLRQLKKLMKQSNKMLAENGNLVLGSRNRLFNIYSLNKYTEDELKEKSINALMQEAIRISKGEKIEKLLKMKTAKLQKQGKEHLETGIKVKTRYQYTPAQLAKIAKQGGFKATEIKFLHLHSIGSEAITGSTFMINLKKEATKKGVD